MKRIVCLLLALVMCLSLFAGCAAKSNDTPADTTPPADNTPSAEAPAAADDADDNADNAADQTATISGELEIAAFSNGEAQDKFWNTAVEEFNKLYPDCKVNLITSANIEESMRPRFVSDNAPDIYFMGGQANADVTPLTAEGKFMDLTDWYNSVEAIGYDGLLKDNMATEMFNRQNGGIYGMGFYYGVWACLYNKNMLEEHGWTLPNNWAEFEALAKEIKDTTDIYPIIHQGQYPDYIGYGLMQSGIATDGGKELLCEEGNLNVDAFDNPAVVSAYEKLAEVRANDWSPEFCLSMSHTEAQMMWLQGKALFLPCGNWLAGEMADSLPEDFEIGLCPTFWHDSDNTPNMVANTAFVAVSADTKNPDAALAFMQVLFSKNVTRAVAECGMGIPCMRDELEGIDLGQENTQVLELANSGAAEIICEIGGSGNFEPYAELRTAVKNTIASILSGEKDTTTALTDLKAEVARIRDDSSIAKVTITVS